MGILEMRGRRTGADAHIYDRVNIFPSLFTGYSHQLTTPISISSVAAIHKGQAYLATSAGPGQSEGGDCNGPCQIIGVDESFVDVVCAHNPSDCNDETETKQEDDCYALPSWHL